MLWRSFFIWTPKKFANGMACLSKAIFPTACSFPHPIPFGGGPASLRVPIRFDPAFDPSRTEFLTRMVERWEISKERYSTVPRAIFTVTWAWMIAGWNHCSDPEAWFWSTQTSRKFKILGGTMNMSAQFTSSKSVRDSAAAGAAARTENSCSFPIHCRPAHRRSIATLRSRNYRPGGRVAMRLL